MGTNVSGGPTGQTRRYDDDSMIGELPNGYLRAPDPAVLVLRGDDAGEFLNGQVSNDVASLADGDSKYALLLTPKGKIRAELTIARDGDETLVVCAREQLPAILKTIETFRIGFFFAVEDAGEQFALIHLVGNQAAAAAEQLSSPVVVLGSPLGADLLVEQSDLSAVSSELTAKGLAELSKDELDAARIGRGVPKFGAEIDENTFPAEAGLEARAVSFEKGCYVGQETVARMHYKGHPNRQLRILRSDQPLKSGQLVHSADGRELGKLGTTHSGAEGEHLALAILRREAETGSTVEAGGVTATIVEISTPAAAN